MTNAADDAQEVQLPPEEDENAPAAAQVVAARKPGRPRKSGGSSRARASSSSSTPRATTPNREGTRPDRPLNKSEVESVRADIAGALLGFNLLLSMFAPPLALDQGDMKPSDIVPQGNEVEKLTDALVSEVEGSASLRAWVRKAGQISPHMKLALAVGSILVARLGVLLGSGQQESDQDGTTNDGNDRSFAPPARMAPGAAHGGDRDDRVG